jgi:hypothetical protein
MTGATNPSVVALSGLYRLVRRTIEAINLVAQSWGRASVGPGDEILISHLGHHANIVPWQQRAAERGARLRVIPVDDSGQILLDQYRSLLSDRTGWWPSPTSPTPRARSSPSIRSWNRPMLSALAC